MALQPVLIEREMQRRYALAPVGVDRSHHRAGLHHCSHLRRDVTQLVGIRAHHAERHRERGIRTKHQLRDAHAGFRRKAVGHRLTQS